ncbi:MAG: ATP-dependent RecD-like DNA helicase [Synergistaceae bacterium]|nr:ATP-dependent RecD-like DNA helicase [Synergistaceae bacterium]
MTGELKPDIETIRGRLERVTYYNEENGYSVYKLRSSEDGDVVAAVGAGGRHMPGEELELYGNWTVHPKFGIQFQFAACRTARPSSVEGIRKYLSSGLVKGIGPRMAARMTDMFGEDTLNVIDENPDILLKVRGVSRRLLDSIKQSWDSQREILDVMYFLQEYGVSPAFAAKIFKEYGRDAMRVVKENPYRLADEIFGIGFLTADRLASRMGVKHDSEMRLDAGVKYVLDDLTNRGGSVYAPRGELSAKAAELLKVREDQADAAAARAIAAGGLAQDIVSVDGDDVRAVYLPSYYFFETRAASKLARLMRPSPGSDEASGYSGLDADAAAVWARDVMGIELSESQMSALGMALSSKVLIITGGPGTGKTTLIRAVIGIMAGRGLCVRLAAPTGRAAKRMTEATGHDAMTIHRLLESNGSDFARGEDSPLKCDLLIVDEVSMIDIHIMYRLLDALAPESHLILVGDANQLPSVGPGSVLKDLISSGKIPVAELNVIFRQARDSGIIVNAHRVNAGMMPETEGGRALRDFYFVEQEDAGKCVEMILTLVRERIPERFGLDPVKDVQVLTPMRKGALGSENLNAVLRKELNPGRGDALSAAGRIYQPGDKVMQIHNDYDREVYNGDIGFVSKADVLAKLIGVMFDEREEMYELSDLDSLVHAYAVSIHKSQGSEYPAVIIPVHMQHYVLLQRNLIYTGITRAKELAVLIGSRRALAMAVRSDRTSRRHTYLSSRLVSAVKEYGI